MKLSNLKLDESNNLNKYVPSNLSKKEKTEKRFSNSLGYPAYTFTELCQWKGFKEAERLGKMYSSMALEKFNSCVLANTYLVWLKEK